MKALSETRRIALQVSTMYELDYDEVFNKIKDMSLEEFREWKSELQTKKTLKDE